MRRLRRTGGGDETGTGDIDQNSQVEQAHAAQEPANAPATDITDPQAVLGPEAAQAGAGRRRKAATPEPPATPVQSAPAPTSADQKPEDRPPPYTYSNSGRVVVTLGEETYNPRQYCTYRVGPLTAETQLRPNESVSGAIARLTLELELAFVLERKRKREIYMAEIGG